MARWQGFGIGDIERRPTDAAVVECFEQGLLVYQAAARDIHQVQARLGAAQGLAVDQVSGLRGAWRGQHDMIGPRQQRADVGDDFHARRRCRGATKHDHPHAQGDRLGGERLSDSAVAHQAQHAASQRRRGAEPPVPRT